MAIVRLPRALLKNYLFLYLLPLRGREPHFRLGSPPIIWLHFLFPLPMSGDPRSLRWEHLRDPHSLLTVTFWLLDNVSSTVGGYHSHLLVSVSHHVTISKLFSSIWPIYRNQSGSTTLSNSGPGSDSNKGRSLEPRHQIFFHHV